MQIKKESPRQELGAFAGNGNLRGILEMNSTGLSHEAIDLLVDIVLRYCEPRPPKRRRLKSQTS